MWINLLLLLFRDLDAEGVKVTAYVTAHLNVDGDVYAEAAAVSEIKTSPQAKRHELSLQVTF